MIFIILTVAALLLIARMWAVLDAFFSEYPHLWRLLSGNYLTRRHGREPIARKRRLRRAGIRTSCLFSLVGLGWAYTYHRQATIHALIIGGAVVTVFGAWRLWRFRPVHHFRWVRPARRAITAELGAPPDSFKVARDRSEVSIGLPLDQVLDDKRQKALEYAACERLQITAAPAWKQYGASPHVILRRVEPCPSLIGWEAFEDACASAARNELVIGMGEDGKIIKVSLTQDSPHFGISMGSQGGKSNFAAFLLLQALRRGDIALILDAKWVSHPWVFKDMDSEYGQLPCVRYARRTEDLHEAMVWLDGEVDRRAQMADRIINAKGQMPAHKGTVGPRLWVLAEEMNLAADRLKEHWATIRVKGDPSRSPAFKGFGACAQAGAQLDIHMVVIAQQLTAASVGGGAVRENMAARFIGRYTQNTWRMLAGDLPMPPSVNTPGRIQCVVGPSVDAAQTPLMDTEQVRELVLAGQMTAVPHDMPGIATSVFGPSVLAGNVPALVASDQGIDLGTPALPPSRPPGTVTLREAVEGGLLEMKLETAQRASTRPGWPEQQGREGRAFLYRISDLQKVKR